METTNSHIAIDSPTVLFVADSHFRSPDLPGELERRRRFAAFFDRIGAEATVFLLGDIFDFYFEWRSVALKRYFDVFHALYACKRRGADLHFLGGNHDYWTGDFLENELGITIHWGDEILLEAQGRRVCCAHGDLTIPGDDNYRRVRAVIRNRYVIAAAKILHPDLMSAIATRVSNGSRKRRRRRQEEMANLLAESASDRFFQKGNDAFIMGHVHYPLHRVYDGKDFMIVGDWIQNFTYGKLEAGRLALETTELVDG